MLNIFLYAYLPPYTRCGEIFLRFFSPFFLRIFQLFSFESSLYMLDTNPFLDMSFANIFFQSVICLLALLRDICRAKVMLSDEIQVNNFSFLHHASV